MEFVQDWIRYEEVIMSLASTLVKFETSSGGERGVGGGGEFAIAKCF